MSAEEGEETMPAALDCSPLHPPSSLDLAFRFGARRVPGSEAYFVVLALAMHGGLAMAARAAPARAVEITRVTEVDLSPPPPPEPRKVAPPEPTEAKGPATKPPAQPRPPQAARAGALLTAKESAPSAIKDDLVDFVTDPAGTSYGSGVVARGGTADHGEHGAAAAGVGSAPVPAAAPPRGDGLVAAANLSRRAALHEANACAGFYPSEADADSGAVTLTLVVRADGGVSAASIVSESPAGQGFGKAARACLQTKRFEPSLDRSGTPVTAAATIRLRFSR
jgi:protein TonB